MMNRQTVVVSKAEAIRNYIEAVPDAKAGDVVNQLKKSGIKVNAQDVYFQRSFMKRLRKRQRAERMAQERQEDGKGRTHSASPGYAVDVICRVANLGKEVGGTRNLKLLVDALAQ